MPRNNALIGYAVLRANYNANARSYLDNFQPFVLSTLAEAHPTALERSTISKSIADQFGLRIPELVVGKLLRRLSKTKTVELVGHTAARITTEGLRDAPTLRASVARYERQRQELVEEFKRFTSTHHPNYAHLIHDDIADRLTHYIEEHAVPLLGQSMRGSTHSSTRTENSAAIEYLVASFVYNLSLHDQVRFNYVVEVAKGAILSTVLTLDTSGFAKSLSGLTLYLDTPLIMDSLGFHGEPPCLAARQMLDLAITQGASLRAFNHTIGEVQGILESAASALRRSNGSRSTSSAYLNFIERGMSAADVLVLQGRLMTLLREQSISIVERPDGYYEYGLDEVALEDALQNRIHYREAAARVNDVRSLSAVHRLRKGQSATDLEGTRALLVTSNSSLVGAAIAFRDKSDHYPLAVTDETLAGLLWVRSPAINPEVPKALIISSAYTGMQPSATLWTKYLDEIDLLEGRAAVSADEALILRTSGSAQAFLMEETLGDASAITEESAVEVLRRVKEELQAPLAEEIESVKSRAVAAERLAQVAQIDKAASELVAADEVERLQRELAARGETERSVRDYIRKTVTFRVRLAVRIAAGCIALALAWGAWSAFAHSQAPTGRLLGSAVAIAALVAVLGAVRTVFPGTILDWVKPLEERIIAARERAVLRRNGLN